MKLFARGYQRGLERRHHIHILTECCRYKTARQQSNWPPMEQENKGLWTPGLWGNREGELVSNLLCLAASKSNTDRLEAWKLWRWLWLDTQKNRAITNSRRKAKHLIKMKGLGSNIHRGGRRVRSKQKKRTCICRASKDLSNGEMKMTKMLSQLTSLKCFFF